MAYLFPIGTITGGADYGTINGKNYYIFEPNAEDGCLSNPVYSVLTTRYQDQTLLARKKAEPYLVITYNYENIFAREFDQIQAFIDEVDDALTSFYVIDFSKGLTPTSVTDNGTNWAVAIDITRPYSTVTNSKANYAILWNAIRRSYRMGSVTTVTANTSIVVEETYGNLSAANAATQTMVYPVYTCYVAPNSLSSFKATNYAIDTMSFSGAGGTMYSGSLTFTSKYKV